MIRNITLSDSRDSRDVTHATDPALQLEIHFGIF